MPYEPPVTRALGIPATIEEYPAPARIVRAYDVPLPLTAAALPWAAVVVSVSVREADRTGNGGWMRCEVLGRPARGAAARLRAGRGREPAGRARPGRRRRRLQARRRARARLHD